MFYSVVLSRGVGKFGKAIKKKRKNHFTKILPTGIALLAVWVTNGIWHGPQWNYLVYGLYYFVIIFGGMLCQPLFDRLYAKLHLDKDCLGLTVFRHVRTLLIIVVGETIFGAASIGDAWHILSHVFVPYRGSLLSFGLDWKEYVVLGLGAAVLFAVDLLKEKKIDVAGKIDGLILPVRWAVYLSAVVVILMFGAYGDPYTAVPFLYGNF